MFQTSKTTNSYQARTNGSKSIQLKSGLLLYVGVVAKLFFDPGRWSWRDLALLQSNTAKIGRSLLTNRTTLAKPIHKKWHGDLVVGYCPRCSEIWHKSWLQKDVGFLCGPFITTRWLYTTGAKLLTQISRQSVRIAWMIWMKQSYIDFNIARRLKKFGNSLSLPFIRP